MDYFELFDIPVSLEVNKGNLSAKYFALQKQYHPDMFAQATEAEQATALELSSMINKAFRTFQQPDENIKYVLQQKGLLEEEEKYQLSPDFLMEMMDLNEQLMDAGGDPSVAGRVQLSVEQFKQAIYEPVKTIIANYQEGITTKEELLQVKEYYYRKKYLNRILAGIK